MKLAVLALDYDGTFTRDDRPHATLLAPPIRPGFVKRLGAALGIPFGAGQCLVDADASSADWILHVIRELDRWRRSATAAASAAPCAALPGSQRGDRSVVARPRRETPVHPLGAAHVERDAAPHRDAAPNRCGRKTLLPARRDQPPTAGLRPAAASRLPPAIRLGTVPGDLRVMRVIACVPSIDTPLAREIAHCLDRIRITPRNHLRRPWNDADLIDVCPRRGFRHEHVTGSGAGTGSGYRGRVPDGDVAALRTHPDDHP